MAKSFLTNINMNQNELVNAVVQNSGESPSNPVAGQLWYDSTNKALKYYDGTNWISAADAPVTDVQVDGTTVVSGKVADITLSDFGITATAANINTTASSGITADKVSGYDNHIGNSNIHVTSEDKAAWNAKYDKPATGIPEDDLADAVKTKLNKDYVETVTLSAGSENGTLKLTVDGTAGSDVKVTGLGSAAYTESSAYDASGAAAQALTDAKAYTDDEIEDLVDTLTGTPGAANTVTAFDEVNGKVTATFAPISITLSQVSDAGAAAAKGVTTTISSESTDAEVPTAKAVQTAIAELPQAMIFRGTLGEGGTITALPTASASTEGDVYKVITDGTYAEQAAKVGDSFICGKLTDTPAATYGWVLVKGSDQNSDTWRNIKIKGEEKLGNAISTGAVDFIDGTAINVSFNETDNQISFNHAEVGTAQATVGLYKITTNSQGHVTSTTAAVKSDITALGIPAQDTTYTFTQDATDGHKITLTPAGGSGTTLTIPDNDTTYTAGTYLTLNGTEINHDNSGATAGSYGPSEDVSGAIVNIPYITVDAQGHITSVVNHTFTPSSDAKKVNKTVTFSNATSTSIEVANATEAWANVQVYDSTGAEVVMDISQSYADNKITITFSVAKANSNSYTAVVVYK